jgi:thiamine phosphate synthase YjbQ (UPF0047 family)
MNTRLDTLALQTTEKQQLINITSRVKEAVTGSGIKNGFIGLFSQHTTAALIVSEFFDRRYRSFPAPRRSGRPAL